MKKVSVSGLVKCVIPPAVVNCTGLTLIECVIYGQVNSMKEKGLTVYASNDYLAIVCRCHPRHVRRSITLLVKVGLLRRELIKRPGHEEISQRYLHALKPWESDRTWTFTAADRERLDLPLDEAA